MKAMRRASVRDASPGLSLVADLWLSLAGGRAPPCEERAAPFRATRFGHVLITLAREGVAWVREPMDIGSLCPSDVPCLVRFSDRHAALVVKVDGETLTAFDSQSAALVTFEKRQRTFDVYWIAHGDAPPKDQLLRAALRPELAAQWFALGCFGLSLGLFEAFLPALAGYSDFWPTGQAGLWLLLTLLVPLEGFGIFVARRKAAAFSKANRHLRAQAGLYPSGAHGLDQKRQEALGLLPRTGAPMLLLALFWGYAALALPLGIWLAALMTVAVEAKASRISAALTQAQARLLVQENDLRQHWRHMRLCAIEAPWFARYAFTLRAWFSHFASFLSLTALKPIVAWLILWVSALVFIPFLTAQIVNGAEPLAVLLFLWLTMKAVMPLAPFFANLPSARGLANETSLR